MKKGHRRFDGPFCLIAERIDELSACRLHLDERHSRHRAAAVGRAAATARTRRLRPALRTSALHLAWLGQLFLLGCNRPIQILEPELLAGAFVRDDDNAHVAAGLELAE